MNEAVDDFVKAARNEPFAVRRFTYNYEQYKKDLENRQELEHKSEYIKTQLGNRSFYGFSELFIYLMHLKVIRAFIDGVLRFGIPPNFYLGIIRPHKG